jgi:hypothetical protein
MALRRVDQAGQFRLGVGQLELFDDPESARAAASELSQVLWDRAKSPIMKYSMMFIQ